VQFAAVLKAQAPRLGLSLQLVEVESEAAFSQAFKSIEVARPHALYVMPSIFLFTYLARIMEFANGRKLPVVGISTEFVEAGALMSYHPNFSELLRLAATQAAKILEGAKPADLPVQQASVFELVINMKTAKGLGIKIPQSMLLRADRVIE
jgi:putative ABC transport system substrate-binding protein